MNDFLSSIQIAFHLIITFDPELYEIIFRTLAVSLTALMFAAIIAIPLGITIALNKFPLKSLVITIFNTFLAIPPVVVGLVVYILLSRKMGLLGPYRLLFTTWAMIIAQFLLALPILTALSIIAAKNLDSGIVNLANSYGASKSQFFRLVLRESRYEILAAIIVGFGRLISEVGAVMMVGGNIKGETRVMTTAIAMNKGMGEFNVALAIGIVLLIVAFIVNFLLDLLRSDRGILAE